MAGNSTGQRWDYAGGMQAESTPSISRRIVTALKRPRMWIELAVFVALFLGIRTWQRRDLPAGQAPLLSGATIAGEQRALLRDGTPTVVHFWATWCGVCDAMDGQVASVAKDHRVLTVATRSGDAASVRDAMREDGLVEGDAPAFDVLLDEDGALARAWGVTSLPTTFVIGGDGSIRSTEVGYTTEVGLRLRAWLAR